MDQEIETHHEEEVVSPEVVSPKVASPKATIEQEPNPVTPGKGVSSPEIIDFTAEGDEESQENVSEVADPGLSDPQQEPEVVEEHTTSSYGYGQGVIIHHPVKHIMISSLSFWSPSGVDTLFVQHGTSVTSADLNEFVVVNITKRGDSYKRSSQNELWCIPKSLYFSYIDGDANFDKGDLTVLFPCDIVSAGEVFSGPKQDQIMAHASAIFMKMNEMPKRHKCYTQLSTIATDPEPERPRGRRKSKQTKFYREETYQPKKRKAKPKQPPRGKASTYKVETRSSHKETPANDEPPPKRRHKSSSSFKAVQEMMNSFKDIQSKFKDAISSAKVQKDKPQIAPAAFHAELEMVNSKHLNFLQDIVQRTFEPPSKQQPTSAPAQPTPIQQPVQYAQPTQYALPPPPQTIQYAQPPQYAPPSQYVQPPQQPPQQPQPAQPLPQQHTPYTQPPPQQNSQFAQPPPQQHTQYPPQQHTQYAQPPLHQHTQYAQPPPQQPTSSYDVVDLVPYSARDAELRSRYNYACLYLNHR